MDALISIDGEEWSVKADEPLSPTSQAVFDNIRRKHTARGDSGVSEIIRNNLERKRLLGQLHRDGMASWVNTGSKALFDKLVKEAASRPSLTGRFIEEDSDASRPSITPEVRADSEYGLWKIRGFSELQGFSESVIIGPALLKAASILAEPAMKSAKQKHTSYTIRSALKKRLGQRWYVVGFADAFERDAGRSVKMGSDSLERRKGISKPEDSPSQVNDERTP